MPISFNQLIYEKYLMNIPKYHLDFCYRQIAMIIET